jgi:hypothetical protein
MHYRAVASPDDEVAGDATCDREPVSFRRPVTLAEIEARISAGRQRYVAACFAGDAGEAQFWVHEILRLEDLRPALQRQSLAS